MNDVISVENIKKMYLLGNFGYGTLRHDLQSWIAKIMGKEDPNAKLGGPKLGEVNEEFWALKGVSFKIQQGDRVGILGRNGSGKSTILKIMSRLTVPTDGVVRMKGRVASLLEVGTGFHPDLTGRENVYLNGSILGMRRWEIKKKLDEIVAFAEVAQFIDTPVKRYSSGMYVRLAFSVAAHLDTDILLIDEVLAVGDANFQTKCIKRMQDASTIEGRTIVFVSHAQAQIEALCNKAVLLNSGTKIVEGDVKEVLIQYNKLIN